MVFLIVRIFIRAHKLRMTSTIIIFCLIIPLLLSFIVLAARIHETNTKIEAIIMVDQVSVKSEPSDKSAEQFYLHVGAKVRIEDESGDWLRIRLADGKTGWLAKDTLEII
jgi:SH3-like domain-containing protein